MRLKRTYRIAEEAADRAAKIAEKTGESASAVVEAALLSYDPEQGSSDREIVVGNDADECLFVEQLRKKDEQILSLLAQLEAKDSHISSLTEALISAQDTAKAAQLLHAADAIPNALGSVGDVTEAKEKAEKKTRWQRLRAAWKE